MKFEPDYLEFKQLPDSLSQAGQRLAQLRQSLSAACRILNDSADILNEVKSFSKDEITDGEKEAGADYTKLAEVAENAIKSFSESKPISKTK